MPKFIRCRRLLLAAGLPIALIAALLSAGTAGAAQQQICGNGGPGYCLNAWNGGPAVKMYNGNTTNEDFYDEYVPLCNGHLVTLTCPLANHRFDAQLQNSPIIQIVYAPTGQCVGSDSSGHGILTGCNSATTGLGGGTGTVQILYGSDPGCYGFPPGYLLNRHYTDLDDAYVNVESGGNPGQPLLMGTVILGQVTCWGGVSG